MHLDADVRCKVCWGDTISPWVLPLGCDQLLHSCSMVPLWAKAVDARLFFNSIAPHPSDWDPVAHHPLLFGISMRSLAVISFESSGDFNGKAALSLGLHSFSSSVLLPF